MTLLHSLWRPPVRALAKRVATEAQVQEFLESRTAVSPAVKGEALQNEVVPRMLGVSEATVKRSKRGLKTKAVLKKSATRVKRLAVLNERDRTHLCFGSITPVERSELLEQLERNSPVRNGRVLRKSARASLLSRLDRAALGDCRWDRRNKAPFR